MHVITVQLASRSGRGIHMGKMQLAGFDHILTKPFKIPELMEILRTRLEAA